MTEIPIDFDLANELFYYDPESPTGLRHKIANGGRGVKRRNPHDVAGYVDTGKNYLSVNFNGKSTRVHRIICVLHGIQIQGKQIDHIDGNRQNNKIENLRVVDAFANARNQKPRKTNKSGVVGVSFHKTKHAGMYRATVVNLNKKIIAKSFSVLKYGEDRAKQMAIDWRTTMIDQLNKLDAGYTERHLGFNKKARGRG